MYRQINEKSKVKIVHTSVHGVGHTFVQAAFKAFDLQPPYAVEEQKDPDPEFPTVKYPNPEEGEGVLVSRECIVRLVFTLNEIFGLRYVLHKSDDIQKTK